MKRANQTKNFIKNARTLGAVHTHTHTHTQVVLKDRKITQEYCVYIC